MASDPFCSQPEWCRPCVRSSSVHSETQEDKSFCVCYSSPVSRRILWNEVCSCERTLWSHWQPASYGRTCKWANDVLWKPGLKLTHRPGPCEERGSSPGRSRVRHEGLLDCDESSWCPGCCLSGPQLAWSLLRRNATAPSNQSDTEEEAIEGFHGIDQDSNNGVHSSQASSRTAELKEKDAIHRSIGSMWVMATNRS